MANNTPGAELTERSKPIYRQSAAVPFRTRDGELEVLLITTLRRRRWIFPKGLIDPGCSPVEAAAIEAFEEAGVSGTVYPDSVGYYEYHKWGGLCQVQVFLMEVDEIADNWPESGSRDREWFAMDEAINLVAEGELRRILRDLPQMISSLKHFLFAGMTTQGAQSLLHLVRATSYAFM
jgi:8-oxo-dGTP pyrophosphatase MutT (NUDIX family)